MNLRTLKYLIFRIRGWLPKELTISNYQGGSHKKPKTGIQVKIVVFVMGCVGGLLGFLGFYSEIGVFISALAITVGVALVAVITIVSSKRKKIQRSVNPMSAQKSVEEQIRGWFPTEPKMLAGQMNTEKPKHAPKKAPTVLERLVGGLGAAGGGLTLSGIIMNFVPAYPSQATVMLFIVGVPLLTAAILIWLSYRKGGTHR